MSQVENVNLSRFVMRPNMLMSILLFLILVFEMVMLVLLACVECLVAGVWQLKSEKIAPNLAIKGYCRNNIWIHDFISRREG